MCIRDSSRCLTSDIFLNVCLCVCYRFSRQPLNRLLWNLTRCFEMVSERQLTILVSIGCVFNPIQTGGGVKMTRSTILSYTATKIHIDRLPNFLTFPKMVTGKFWKKRFFVRWPGWRHETSDDVIKKIKFSNFTRIPCDPSLEKGDQYEYFSEKIIKKYSFWSKLCHF